MFEINIQLSDTGADLFSETDTDFSIEFLIKFDINSNMKVTIEMGYDERCVVLSDINPSTANIAVILPSSS